MDLTKISFPKNFPEEVNVVIEIPQNSIGLKYEVDKESGAVFVDRFLTAPMYYPANYGFVPNTLGGDGDPIDVMVISPFAIHPGIVITSRVIGVLMMEDEGGMDEKIIAVPASSISKEYDNIKEIADLPELLVKQIKHFFERYKDLEKNKWVKVTGFKSAHEAFELIKTSKK